MVFLLSSCALRPGTRAPQISPDIEITVQYLKERRAFEGVSALRGEVKTRIRQRGRKVASFSGAIAFRPPDTMRLKMFTPFGTTAADLVRVVGRTEVYVPGKERLFVGWTPSLTIPKDAEYSMAMISGTPALIVRANGGELIAMYLYDPATMENTALQAFKNDEMALELRFSDYDGSIPGTMEFDFNGLEIEIRLSEPELVDVLKDRLFHPFEKEGKSIYPLQSLFLNNK
jgi:hypothetical protein